MKIPEQMPDLRVASNLAPQEPEPTPSRIGECRRFPPSFHPSLGPVFPITSIHDRFGRPCGCGQCAPISGNKPTMRCEECRFWVEITDPAEQEMVLTDFEEEEEEEEEAGEQRPESVETAGPPKLTLMVNDSALPPEPPAEPKLGKPDQKE